MNSLLPFFDYLRELNFAALFVKIVLSVFFGGIIGIGRGQKHRAAGCRTYMIVCLGATLTMILSQYEAHMLTVWADRLPFIVSTDVSRFGAQVIKGIGFLGAGTILREGFSVKGLTTAASLWAVSCIGLAVGAGYYIGALVSTVVIYLTLNTFKRFIIRGNPSKNIYIEAENMTKQAADVGAIIKRYGGNLHTLEILYADTSSTKRKSDSIVMKAVVFPRDEEGLNLTISAIRSLEGIRDLYID